MKRRIITTALVALAFPLASLAQDAATPPATPPASLRASRATTRPVISQAEAYALKKENAELTKQLKDLKAQLAQKTKTVATATPAKTERELAIEDLHRGEKITPAEHAAHDQMNKDNAAMYKTNKSTYEAFTGSLVGSTLADMTKKAKDNGWTVIDPTLSTQSGNMKLYTVDLSGGYPVNDKEFLVTVDGQGLITSFQVGDGPHLN